MLFAVLSLMLSLQTQDPILTQIGVDQQLGVNVDPGISFHDENGNTVKLGDFLGRKKPILLMPVYFNCPMLCGMQLNALVRAMKVLTFTVGKEFEIVTFSIDPNEGPELARSKKERYVRDYGRSEAQAGWHFLTGDADAIHRLTSSIGFRYTYDQAIGQWAHASALIVLTPAGRVSQYFNGIEYDPQQLKYSVIQASDEKIGSIIDRIVLLCYQYDAHSGKYSLMVLRTVRVAGVATMLGIIAFCLAARKRRGSTRLPPGGDGVKRRLRIVRS